MQIFDRMTSGNSCESYKNNPVKAGYFILTSGRFTYHMSILLQENFTNHPLNHSNAFITCNVKAFSMIINQLSDQIIKMSSTFVLLSWSS